MQMFYYGPGFFTQSGNSFNGIDFSSQFRQDTSLVAGTGSNFKDFLAGLYFQQLCLIGNSIGLRNGLPLPYRKSLVLISLFRKRGFEKEMPGNLFNGLKNTVVKSKFRGKNTYKPLSHAFIFVLVQEVGGH